MKLTLFYVEDESLNDRMIEGKKANKGKNGNEFSYFLSITYDSYYIIRSVLCAWKTSKWNLLQLQVKRAFRYQRMLLSSLIEEIYLPADQLIT